MDSSLHSETAVSAESVSDETLALSVQKGNTDAFGELVTRYEKKLARYGTKFLSNPEDITDLVPALTDRHTQDGK